MMQQETKCPYCNEIIDNSIEQCPKCKEWFVEPCIKGFRFNSLYAYIACDYALMAVGLNFVCGLIWNFINKNTIYSLANEKDSKKFKLLLYTFVITVFATLFIKLFVPLAFVLEIMLAYRVVRIIEKFTCNKYETSIYHHNAGLFFFRTLYVVHFLDTYNQRVKDPNLRYIIDKGLLIIAVILVGLYLYTVFRPLFTFHNLMACTIMLG